MDIQDVIHTQRREARERGRCSESACLPDTTENERERSQARFRCAPLPYVVTPSGNPRGAVREAGNISVPAQARISFNAASNFPFH